MREWTIRYTDEGQQAELQPMEEEQAKKMLDDVRRVIDPSAAMVNLLEVLRRRFPEGAEVRNHVSGHVGTVEPGPPLGGGGDMVAHCIEGGGVSKKEFVSVRLEGLGYPQWFAAEFWHST